MNRLTEKGIVRRLGLHERAAYFVLIVPGEHHDYLICKKCSAIAPIDYPCPVDRLKDQIHRASGFRELYHELEFFGTCPKCA